MYFDIDLEKIQKREKKDSSSSINQETEGKRILLSDNKI